MAKQPKFTTYKPTKYKAPQRNLLQETKDGVASMEYAYPKILALNQQYGGQFAKNEVDIAAQRSAAETAAIKADGGALRRAMLESTPELAKANSALMARIDELGPSAIEKELNAQALGELKLGGQLTAEEQRAATQSARTAASARGMATGQSAAIAEVLNRDSFARGRQNERRAFASGVDGQTLQRRTADSASANNLFNTAGAFWDPQQRLFGKGGSQVSGQVSGPGTFTPFLEAGGDVGKSNQLSKLQTNATNQAGEQFAQERLDTRYYTMFNAQQTNANAAANRSASNKNAAIGAGASILAAVALAFL